MRLLPWLQDQGCINTPLTILIILSFLNSVVMLKTDSHSQLWSPGASRPRQGSILGRPISGNAVHSCLRGHQDWPSHRISRSSRGTIILIRSCQVIRTVLIRSWQVLYSWISYPTTPFWLRLIYNYLTPVIIKNSNTIFSFESLMLQILLFHGQGDAIFYKLSLNLC